MSCPSSFVVIECALTWTLHLLFPCGPIEDCVAIYGGGGKWYDKNCFVGLPFFIVEFGVPGNTEDLWVKEEDDGSFDDDEFIESDDDDDDDDDDDNKKAKDK